MGAASGRVTVGFCVLAGGVAGAARCGRDPDADAGQLGRVRPVAVMEVAVMQVTVMQVTVMQVRSCGQGLVGGGLAGRGPGSWRG